jgi:hypothetical protein
MVALQMLTDFDQFIYIMKNEWRAGLKYVTKILIKRRELLYLKIDTNEF